MSLRINDTAPDFKAKTSEGDISFHDWIGDGWAILFSHPKVCRSPVALRVRFFSATTSEFYTLFYHHYQFFP